MSQRMTSTVFRDFTMLMVLGFVVMVVWLLPHVNPPASSSSHDPPGNVVIAITWPEGDIDIDLWVTGPGEMRPVGYSNKGGMLFNLLRDDLGNMPDATPLNYENAYSRGIVAGEYIVNVHCYRCPVVPQRVDVEITLNTKIGLPEANNKRTKLLATTSVELTSNGQEKTALRFKLNAKGELEHNSMNNIFRPLRAAGS